LATVQLIDVLHAPDGGHTTTTTGRRAARSVRAWQAA
jgi:hypothetical protein